jgi:four helix bundle protein
MEDKGQFNEEVRKRTMCMSVEVRNLLANSHILAIDRPTVNQLIRSSSSVAANYRSATRARSDAEFYSKISIVVEEADETLFWIEYLVKLSVVDEQATANLRNEIDQLVRLFSTIRRKMKEKLERVVKG